MNVTNANVIHLGIAETLTEDEQSLLGERYPRMQPTLEFESSLLLSAQITYKDE